MTVLELSEKLSLKPLALPSGEREIRGVYVGDLLSWVMGRAQSDNAWITIMSNVNIVAVASLVDVSCIILAEGAIPDASVCAVAEQKGVNLLSSDSTAYEIAKELAALAI